MADKRVLFADADPQALAEFRQALGDAWEVTGAASGPEALDALNQRSYQVVVAALDLPGLEGAEFLNQVRDKDAQTIRFLLAAEADRERVMKKVFGAHQFLTKPLDSSVLKATIEHAHEVDKWIANNRIRELAARVRVFPTIPSLYLEVLNLLRSPLTTVEEVAGIIAKDMAMMTKLLQVINSAYFGLPRRITDPTEAVGILGFETVKSMVMSIKLLSQYNKLNPVYFSLDRLWQHSTDVARTARDIVMLHTHDRSLASDAFTAGLLHDLGKVVLAANFDEQYAGAHSLARKQQIPLWEIEKEIFGAGHGEIGAYLFGLWGMPMGILEAAALHHDPTRTNNLEFSPLTAVHVANAIEYELHPDEQGLGAPTVDEAYLAAIGCADRLPIWRASVFAHEPGEVVAKLKESAAVQSPAAAHVTPKTAPVKAPPPTAPAQAGAPSAAPAQPHASAPTAPTVSQEPPPKPAGLFHYRRWLYAAGLGTLLLLLVCLGLNGVEDPKALLPVKAKEIVPAAPNTLAPATATPIPAPNPSPSQKPSDGSPALTAAPSPARAAQQSPRKPQPTNDTAESIPPASSNALAPSAPPSATPPTNQTPAPMSPEVLRIPPKVLTVADLRLQGVICSSDNPSAILNGRMIFVGEWIAGARLIEVGRTNVTLEYQNQRKTLTLK
jgi:HD-like signal output (HDOD) protein